MDGVPSGMPTSLPSSQSSDYTSLSVPEICKTIGRWIKLRENQGCKTCISYVFNKYCTSRFPSSFPSTSPSVILTTSRVINDNTYTEGVRIYQKLSGSIAQYAFSVLLPQSNKVYLAGSVTISRCNSKDILGISHDQKTSPCFHTCGKGGLIRECYPELDKQTNDFFDPHLFAKIIVGGKNNNCSCKWTDIVCNKEMHHCTLVLPQCQCSNLNEKNIVAKVVVTANSDGQRVKDNYVVEIENGKGFLAAYSSVINKTKIVRDLIVKKPRYRAQYKDENTEEFFVKHFPVLQTQIPKTITGSKLMIARGTIDIKLDWDEKYHTKKDGRRDTCNPLVVARFIISENKLDSTSGPFNETVVKMDFKNKSTRNCLWSDSVCKYKVIDFVPWEDNFINKWLVLVVGTKKSCIHPTNDYWEAYSGKVGLTIAE